MLSKLRWLTKWALTIVLVVYTIIVAAIVVVPLMIGYYLAEIIKWLDKEKDIPIHKEECLHEEPSDDECVGEEDTSMYCEDCGNCIDEQVEAGYHLGYDKGWKDGVEDIAVKAQKDADAKVTVGDVNHVTG